LNVGITANRAFGARATLGHGLFYNSVRAHIWAARKTYCLRREGCKGTGRHADLAGQRALKAGVCLGCQRALKAGVCLGLELVRQLFDQRRLQYGRSRGWAEVT
jgi:hypothetical protein